VSDVSGFGCIVIKKKKEKNANSVENCANAEFVVAEKYASVIKKKAREGCVPQTKGGVFSY